MIETTKLNQMPGFSVFRYIKRTKYSPLIILILIISITAMVYLLNSQLELQSLAFLFYGLPLVYTAIVYELGLGIEIAIICVACWLLGISPRILHNLEAETSLVLFFLSHVMPISCYMVGCLVLSKLISSEKKMRDKYKALADNYASTAWELSQANKTVRQLYLGMVKVLVKAIDAKDSYTSGHSERVAIYSLAMANRLNLNKDEQCQIFYAAVLHDVGKIGIDREILNKTEPLSKEEYQEIKQHSQIGAEIIGNIEYMKDAMKYVLYHHERFDGSGYPRGLKGEEIPLGARIIGVADTFDAIITQRSYNNRLTTEEALEEIQKNSNKQFDPKIVEVLCKVVKEKQYNIDLTEYLDTLLDL